MTPSPTNTNNRVLDYQPTATTDDFITNTNNRGLDYQPTATTNDLITNQHQQ